MLPRRALLAILAAITLTLPVTAGPAEPPQLPDAVDLDDPAEAGAWSDPIPVPVSAVHAAMLPTGKVLLFESSEGALLWDPATGGIDPAPTGTHFSVNCAGTAILPDGRVMAVSGHSHNHLPSVEDPHPQEALPSTWAGHNRTAIFDPDTGTWAQGPDLNQGRYYPTALTLDDGSVLTVSGNDEEGGPAEMVERLIPGSGTGWSAIESAERNMDFYPRLHLLPGGDIVRTGQEQRALFLDQGSWTWEEGPRGHYGQRWGGTSTLLPGLDQVLVAGGGSWGFGSEGHQTAGLFRDNAQGVAHNVADGLRNGGTPATGHTEILDLSGDEPRFREVDPMTIPRRDHNTVILPTGDVLAVNGGTGWEAIPGWVEHARAPEIFDSGTETWSLGAPANRHRGYHSTALLLPDGRVLVGGGDLQAPTRDAATHPGSAVNTTIELYSPPYLFQGERPAIASAPEVVTYGQGAFEVTSPDAERVQDAALVRLSSVTHSLNTDQRFVTLDITVSGTTVQAQAPEDARVAPPGPYMLFLVSDEGVPSVAEIVSVGPGEPAS